MLQEEIGYYNLEPAEIKSVVSAKLEVCNVFTDMEYYSQTITNEKTLKILEEWFGNAEYIYGGADGGNRAANSAEKSMHMRP